MKKLIMIILVLLNVCSHSSLFSNLDIKVYAQEFDPDQKKYYDKTAILLVSKFKTTFQTENEKLLSSSLPSLIQTSLRGNKYRWLEIVTDSSLFFGSNKFTLNGIILDYSSYLKVKLEITSGENNDSIASPTFRVVIDSILISVDRMSRELASIISEKLPDYEIEKEFNVLIFPFISDIQDTTLNEYGDYLASSLLYEFEKMPIISSVEVSPPGIIEDQIFINIDFKLKGTFHLYEDYSLDVSAVILNAETRSEIYVVHHNIDANDYLAGPRAISDRFNNFLSVYSDIRDELELLQAAKDFYDKGEKYFEDILDPSAKIKAEVMYYKAIEIDTSYIPALIRLGDLAKADLKYDLAFSFYEQILGIDSQLIEAHIGLGDTYYYNLQDSLAIQYYKEAANLGRIKMQESSIVTAYSRLGELYLADGKYSSAINYYNQALEIDTSDLQIWYGLGNSHYLRYSESSHQIEDTTDIYLAVNFFRDGAAHFPEDSTFARNASYLLNYWGKIYYEEYNRVYSDTSAKILADLAYKKFNEASQITNYDNNLMAENLNYLAYLAYFVLWDFENGKEFSRKAVQLHPSDEWTYRLFAVIHKDDTTHIVDALQSIKKAISIEEKAYSYRTLGDIYLTMEKYDSAYVAYQNAMEMEEEVSSATVVGLKNSAIMSNNPQLIKSSIDFMYRELDLYPKKTTYLKWIIELERVLKRYNNIELAVNDYLQQNINKSDSLWAFIQLAEIKREQKDYDSALSYVNQAFELNAISRDATKILDSLCYNDSFPPAVEFKIVLFEKRLEKDRNIDLIRNLSSAYSLIEDYENSINLLESAFSISKSKEDTVDINYSLGTTYYQMGLDSYNVTDSANGYRNMLKAEEHFTIALYPGWQAPLSYLQIINHEYVINFDKSYKWSLQLIQLDPLNTSYIANYIEAAFTSGRFKEAYDRAEKIIVSDSLGTQPLSLESRLATRYILMASKLLDGDPMIAFAEFGAFKRDYTQRPEKKEVEWIWGGSKLFIREYNDFDTSYRDLLLSIIKSLEVERKEGLSILEDVEFKWKSLVTGS